MPLIYFNQGGEAVTVTETVSTTDYTIVTQTLSTNVYTTVEETAALTDTSVTATSSFAFNFSEGGTANYTTNTEWTLYGGVSSLDSSLDGDFSYYTMQYDVTGTVTTATETSTFNFPYTINTIDITYTAESVQLPPS